MSDFLDLDNIPPTGKRIGTQLFIELDGGHFEIIYQTDAFYLLPCGDALQASNRAAGITLPT